MDNLWRRIGNRKSCSKTALDKYVTENKLADLEDGTTTVVLKRLQDVVLSATDFWDKVEAIGAMDHENQLPLRAYFYSEQQRFLLYDYMPMGSLSGQLDTTKRYEFLSGEVRLSIALGAARAIEHLHAQDIHHGNIKSSNVLLTLSFEARVSDYGLPHLTRPDPKGGADLSEADVYDFGVLLPELLTGELSTTTLHNEAGHVVDLPAWVNYIVYTMGTSEVFDAKLRRYHGLEEGIKELFVVANTCVFSNSRPQMSEIQRKIEELCSPGGQ
ncbi:hypothetical protein NL676_034841 [Syzygium grande]|nr:hypothetical protein NL676_034841 [Syzygium grande]